MNSILYPYLPRGKWFYYVDLKNNNMRFARWCALEYSLDTLMPCASVIVKDRQTLGIGANGSAYHAEHGCQRVKLGMKTGEGYELCEGCHPKSHSESKALDHALRRGCDLHNADLYLWGHWWCCQACWKRMISAGINKVFLLERSYILFNREHPENIIGKRPPF